MAPSSEPFRTMRRISIVLREAVPTIQRQRRGGGSISVSRKPLSYYTSSSLLSQNQQYFNSIHNHERLQALSMATPSTQFCRYFSSNDKSADSISAGEDLYRQAIEAMEMATKVQEERQEEQSQKMYEAWQKTQDAETKNPKTQGVVVVKTLVKHVNKQRKAALDNDIQFKQKARDLLEQAAALEHPLSLVQLGNLALEDAKREQQSDRQLAHVSKAMSYFRRAGEAGNRVGWYNLGQLLWTGYPTFEEEDDPVEGVERILEPDMHEAMEAFTHAMDLGDADAMYLVGVHRMSVGYKEVIFSGLRLIEKAGDLGHGGALYYLALFYLNGEEKIKLEPCSLEEFQTRLNTAVDAGSTDAMFTRGHSYYHGTEGYPQNYEKALEDFLNAAEGGNADAAVSAGAMLHTGAGGLQDQVRAFELYQHAGELGSKEGWQNVVACYLTGQGVPRSVETAQYIKETILKE